ncbi:hypothetical protein EJ02DRAFT_432095 [Clathrospora elynae]|uniref:Uncharacterized protein n=1 Tax=Clathrospora elynae TaxID=706981 RepID=A0A6A5SZE4_9PLEO|nr:hypothetical protein EJ02DRAFT_432095 [Clathrospora elynae]
MEPGDLIPADGVFISGHNVLRPLERGHNDSKDLDPFTISGSKVLEGVGTYLVTSVGVNFSSILTALMWGRAFNDAVQKFL